MTTDFKNPVPSTARTLDRPVSGESRSIALLLLLVVLLGLGLRLFHLDHQSLRDDELFSVTVSHMRLHEMWHYLIQDFVHPPLHYLLLHFWFEFAGFGQFQARIPSVVFGTLSIVVTYFIGVQLCGRRAALLAAFLLAVSQRGVMTSQDARPYALILLLVVTCTYVFIIALRTGRAAPWWVFVCMTTLVIYTHYYGAFVIAALVLYGVIYHKRYHVPPIRWIGGALLVVALYLPWLSSGIIRVMLMDYAKGHSGNVLLHWWTPLTVVNEFNNGRILGFNSASNWWAFLLGVLFFSLPAIVALKPLIHETPRDPSARMMRENLVLLLLLCVIPAAAAIITGKVDKPFNIRYITFIGPFYYLLVGFGWSAVNPALLRRALVIVGAFYCAFALRANYFIPYIENYRDAYQHIAQTRESGDCYLGAPTWERTHIRWAWSFYHGDLPPLTLSNIDDFKSDPNSCSRVWLISVNDYEDAGDAAEIKEFQTRLAQIYKEIDKQRYYWVSLDLYQAMDPGLERQAKSTTSNPVGHH